MTNERLKEIINNVLNWGRASDDDEFKECLMVAMDLTEEEMKEFQLEDYICDEEEEYKEYDITIKGELEKREKATGKTLFERQKEESVKTWCDSLEDGTAVMAIFAGIGLIVATIVTIVLCSKLI